MQSISLKQRLARKRSSKKQLVTQRVCILTGRSLLKVKSSSKETFIDEIPERYRLIMDGKQEAQDVGRTRDEVDEKKRRIKKIKIGPESNNEVKSKSNFKDKRRRCRVEGYWNRTERPDLPLQDHNLTLKHFSKIDPKDKGKKKIEEEDESESESDGIPESLRRSLNSLKEQFTIEERAKFLHDTIAAQRKFLAQQRSEAIRNRPPTKNQLRNQMMTYLKHVGNFKHSELKTKKFEEIQALYEKIKRSDEDKVAAEEG
ncbi:hypothetical protein Tco_0320083 [Tanacetum coccineum]